jgi:hypothetical protein
MNTVLSVVVSAYNEAKTIASKLKRVLAQLSHDLAASRPFDDFVVNAFGTLNFFEATRRSRIASPFVHIPTPPMPSVSLKPSQSTPANTPSSAPQKWPPTS